MPPIEFIKEESQRLKKEVREKTLGYILTALGLVAGLAWNDAIKSSIDLLFPSEKNTVLAQFTYAIAVTIAVVLLVTYLSRIFKERKVEEKKEL